MKVYLSFEVEVADDLVSQQTALEWAASTVVSAQNLFDQPGAKLDYKGEVRGRTQTPNPGEHHAKH